MALDPDGYAAAQIATSPPWLQGVNGAAWHFAMGILKDGYLEAAKRAVLARFPLEANADALPRIAHTMGIDPGLADLRGTALLRTALGSAWDAWTQAGTKPGLLARLAELGLPRVEIYEAWEWAPGAPAWWQFWVVLRPKFDGALRWPWDGGMAADKTWGDAGTWAADGDEAAGRWAGAIPDDWLTLIRRTIRQWKPKHAVCQSIILLQSGETFGTRVARPGGYLTWASMTFGWLPAQIAYLEA